MGRYALGIAACVFLAPLPHSWMQLPESTFFRPGRVEQALGQNARLLVLPECHQPNLVSRFMKLMLARLSADWQARWGHPLAAVETFVDPQLYQGTAYQVSGWSQLGRSKGFQRSAVDFYQPHELSLIHISAHTG